VFCLSDYDQQIALVADHYDAAEKRREIIGVGRLGKIHGTSNAEFAVIIRRPLAEEKRGPGRLPAGRDSQGPRGMKRSAGRRRPTSSGRQQVECKRQCQAVGCNDQR
jgi:hypothetical protein